ncbi:MAG: hypothetical protein CVT92_15130 [Bacteroidetes bacterium HGW-Bacteroidetes-1]|jgi:hypothetical protein|nr:MAG: hypothetical protein CVT92_15130 [Bacteroidetes bacterium HGW-Bacteroidetes-1]
MEFIDYKKRIIKHNDPIIMIDKYHFNYNAIFSKIAGLDDFTRVSYSLNIENRAIRFSFHSNDIDEFSYLISNFKNKKTYRSTSGSLVNDHLWIKSVALLKDTSERKFKAIRIGMKNEWFIKLIPSFELKFKVNEVNQIPTSMEGIYQYRDENNKIIYIGKGNIRTRIKEIGRLSDWDISIIEVSEIGSEALQFEWENYWINRFMEKNNGKLPFHNRNQGNKSNNR